VCVCQLLYHNAAARSSFGVMVDDVIFMRCWTSVDAVSASVNSSADNARYKTCYTAGVTRLHAGQKVSIKDLYGTDISDINDSSFFGVVKLSP